MKDILNSGDKERNNIKTAMNSGFCSVRNYSLGRYLHRHGITEEKNNYRAYYLIMDEENIVLYFTLQIGAMIKCEKKEISGIEYVPDQNIYKI